MTPQQIDELVVLASEWVQQQRAQHLPQCAPLPQYRCDLLGLYYDATDLDTVRWRIVPQIENPPWRDKIAAELIAEGLPAIDFREMAGITIVDTMLLSASKRPKGDSGLSSLLVHEMVHVIQYRLLGFERFMHDYVWGLADNGFDYFSIPLEKQAFAIQARAEAGERFLAEPKLREMMGLA